MNLTVRRYLVVLLFPRKEMERQVLDDLDLELEDIIEGHPVLVALALKRILEREQLKALTTDTLCCSCSARMLVRVLLALMVIALDG